MIDIVCPSCQARYRLPDGAIGENGRRVSCSACGHAWVAHPEPEEETLTLGPEAAAEPARGSEPPAAAADKGRDKYAAYDSDERVSGTSPYSDEEDRGMAAYEAFARSQDEDDEDAPKPSGRAAREDELAGDRADQMAQIRSMLDDIKQSPQAESASRPEPVVEEEDEDEYEEPPTPARPSAVERSMREVEEEERDPLRAKLDQYAKPGKTSDPRQTRKRMLQQHAKKVRRRKMQEKRGTGTFMTGFLLVVLVVSVMAAVYLLAPLIIARFPDSEPAIRDYVATMDQFRLWLGEQVGAAQATVERIISDEE